ncbi:MAG: SDR family oxidoreductase [Chloroflexi bacterium]|nr:SDR family oxidoreductase [Chloroflexota bacterium]
MSSWIDLIRSEAGAEAKEIRIGDWVGYRSYTDVESEYNASRNGVGMHDSSYRGLLEVTGADRLTWLHNLTTNEITNLKPGEGNYTFATNLTAKFLTSRACLKHMMPRRSGVILTFSSTAALGPYPRKSHYTASKSGIFGFTRTLAMEVGPYGIRANCIIPGAINTELLQNYIKRIAGEQGRDPGELAKEMSSNSALQRQVEPREVTQTVMWLCSDDASAITGQMIRVCAGAAMW